jgi:septum formation protein
MRQIILASSSAYRKKLFEQLQLSFTTYSPDIDETPLENEPADKMVARLSLAKAKVAAKRYPDAICIGADSTACFNHTIYGKPLTETNAHQQLTQFSGHTVRFYTSISMICHNKDYRYEKTHDIDVTFRDLTPETIQRYVAKDQPLYSCGSVKAEGLGLALVKHIRSEDPTALVGLPVLDLCEELIRHGVEIV